MSEQRVDISFIATSYNDGDFLINNLKKIIKILQMSQYSFEIIIVDDKSTDNSIHQIEKFIEGCLPCKVSLVRHEKNQGRGKSVSDGIRAAHGMYAGFIDIDLSTSPWYIFPLIDELKKGADIAVGYRLYKFRFNIVTRLIMSWGYRFLVRTMLGKYYGDTETGCKFFNREKILPILSLIKDTRWFWDTEVMVRSQNKGFVMVEVPTVFVRSSSQTTVKIFSDTWRAFINLVHLRRELSHAPK